MKRHVATHVIFHQETGPEDDVGDIDTIIGMCVHYLAAQGLLAVKEKAQERGEHPADLDKCPRCNGPADNGHDRCDPPEPYHCSKCEHPDAYQDEELK